MATVPSTQSLKIKIITKKPKPSTDESVKPSLTKVGHVVTEVRSKENESGVAKSCGSRGSQDRKAVAPCNGKQLQSACGMKRGPEPMIDCGAVKKHKFKMDEALVRKCSLILKKLMTHPYGQDFNQPVDPVAFNIPDYFTVISKPMDLGTIKSKLEKDLYASADDFKSDVRLTFSNAMLYNPPGNHYHTIARELNSIFSAKWRFVLSNTDRECMQVKADNGLADGEKKVENARSIRMCSPYTKASPQRSTHVLKQELGRKIPAKNIRNLDEEKKDQISKVASKISNSSAVSRGAKLSVQAENRCCSSMPDVLLKRPTEGTKNMGSKKMTEASIVKKDTLCSPRTFNLKASSELKKDGTESLIKRRRPTESTKEMEPKEDGTQFLAKKRSLAESTKRTEPKGKKETSTEKKVPLSIARTSNLKAPPSNDKRSLEETVHEVAKKHKPLEKRNSFANSEGALNWLDEEPTFASHHATSASPAFNSNDWRPTLCEVQLSPAKAYRAEMLKKRFADTILKAQKRTLLSPDEKNHQMIMEDEKQKLKRQHGQENVKSEDKVKASRDRKMHDIRLQRQREREAARIALEKMERSVEFDDSITSLRDLAYIIGDSSFAGPLRGCGGMYVAATQFVNGKLKSPLERLGLYLKEEDEFVLEEDYEEGEIVI